MSEVSSSIADTGTLTERTTFEIREVLAGRRRSMRSLLSLAGPAVVASIAYMDPGNFATNIQAGARYGYSLLWVVVLANLTAMLFQALSAKLGIVTGRNLAELCRETLPRPLVIAMWIVSEIAAMATDLAEFLGGAIGLSLLLGLPLMAGMAITASLTYALLMFERNGYRPLELVILGLIAAIGLSYLAELLIAPVQWPGVFMHATIPGALSRDAMVLSASIVGATVMPHALFLHSGLTQKRVVPSSHRERRRLLRFSNIEVVVALGVAGAINLAMVIVAAGAFHQGHPEVAEIETAYRTLTPLLGAAAAGFFLVALIASGISSSVVGTIAGQMIMQGFVGFRLPVWVRRLVTMVPAFVVVAAGVRATDALIMSQVVLSLALPVPMIALIWLTSRRKIMGEYCNRPFVILLGMLAAAVVLSLNVFLLVQALAP
jgi:manganese transport protein